MLDVSGIISFHYLHPILILGTPTFPSTNFSSERFDEQLPAMPHLAP